MKNTGLELEILQRLLKDLRWVIENTSTASGEFCSMKEAYKDLSARYCRLHLGNGQGG
jgi:hypothetical protein